jgi:putative ABC transport system permease protein
MDSLWQDISYGLRVLRKRPGFTFLSVLTLAIGIGVNTAIFSIVNAALLRPLPYADPDRLVRIRETRIAKDLSEMEASYPNYVDWTKQNTVFEGLAAYDGINVTLLGRGIPERISGARVTASFFSVLGVQPFLGRDFEREDEHLSSSPIALISYGFWQRSFGGDRAALGQVVNLSNQLYTVIGVLPPSFDFAPSPSQFWVPLRVNDSNTQRNNHWLSTIGRLKPNVSLSQAQAEMTTIAQRLAGEYPETNSRSGVRLLTLREAIVGSARTLLLFLLAAVAFVLLIACANIASLVLARALSRRKELAMRAALGAERLRLVRQLLVESLLLSLIGGLSGLLLSVWSLGPLVRMIPLDFLRDLSVDWRVLSFNFLVSLLTGVLFGLAPALQSSRFSIVQTLKESGPLSSDPGTRRLGNVLVISEVSLVLILLVSTGLITKSLWRLLSVDPGFRREKLLAVSLSLPSARYSEHQQVARFYEEVQRQVASLPGIEDAAVIDELPVTQDRTNVGLYVEGQPPSALDRELDAVWRTTSPNYFALMGITLIRGRSFTPRDKASSPQVAILSETLARQLFQQEDPVGRRIVMATRNRSVWQVVGVVADVKLGELERATRPAFYTSNLQESSTNSNLVIRSAVGQASLVSAVRRVVQTLDPELPVYGVNTMEQLIQNGRGVSTRRSTAVLLSSFAVVALLLAAIGLYGVMSYGVAQRTREIGVRMALGARPRDVLRLVLNNGLRLTLLGIGFGLVGTLGVSRLISSLLFGTSATDSLTLIGASAFLTAVALIACYVPARRAAKVDPIEALRYQ